MTLKTQTDMPQKTDIVLWGATSFVGRLLAAYLWRRYGDTGDVRLALAGRDRSKLEAVHRHLNADDRLPIIVGSASDEAFLDAMTGGASVVVSTVGPYARYGSRLVAACVQNGTDYCDLAGEPQWIRRMIDAHQNRAEDTGARIVHACGFDSIPSDLGVWYLQEEMHKRFGRPADRISMRVGAMRGGVSGGTVASMLHLVEEAQRDRAVARIAKNPYALAPEGMRSGVTQDNVATLAYDRDLRRWVGPFIMAAINTKVVHRSHALLGNAWGPAFRYDEAMVMGAGIKGAFRAAAFAGGLHAFLLGAAFNPTRGLMKRAFLPKPGEGPSPEAQKTGFFKLSFIGTGAEGNRLRVNVTGDRDPGYGSTSKMLGESAVCLLRDVSPAQLAGGFWTPSTAMGPTLMDRLTANAGMTFEVAADTR